MKVDVICNECLKKIRVVERENTVEYTEKMLFHYDICDECIKKKK